jgi:hypothetical protein
MRKSRNAGSAPGCLLIIGLGLVIYLWTIHWGLGAAGTIGLIILAGAATRRRCCDICELQFKRRAYRWKIDGKQYLVCPICNRKLEKEQSNTKFEEFQRKRKG